MPFMKTHHFTPIKEARLAGMDNITFDKPTTATEARKFSGVANSGQPFDLYGERVVIDFDGIQFKPQTPVLLEHKHPAGVAELTVDPERGLLASGSLLDNENGNTIASASDQGFPWEMSVYVQAGSSEQLAAGAKAVVNGKEVAGPLTIWRDCTIREVSFTAVGVDANTTATALSQHLLKGSNMATDNKQPENTADGAQAQIEALKQQIADLKAENAALKQSAKKANTDAKLSAAGFQAAKDGGFKGVSAAMYAALLSANDADRDAMIADLKPTQPEAAQTQTAPAALLSDTEAAADAPNTAKLSGLAADAEARKTQQGVNYV